MPKNNLDGEVANLTIGIKYIVKYDKMSDSYKLAS